MKANNKGFASAELVLFVAVLLIVGVLGYKFMQNRQSKGVKTTYKQSVTAEPANAPEIKSASDLDTASTELDKLNVDKELDEVESLEKDIDSL